MDEGSRKRTWLSWSSGKDSAWALVELRRDPSVDVVGLLTTVSSAFDRVSMHGVRRELLEAQARAAGLPLHVVEIPYPCPNDVYAERMEAALDRARDQGVEAIAFGDLFLDDVRAYRERMLAPTGMEPLFPLWGRPTSVLAHEMIDGGLRAIIVTLDPARIPADFVGRSFDRACIEALPPEVDPCGEHGEFHTFAWAGPMFDAPIDLCKDEAVERDGFVYLDLVPA
jgi:uncharacterized protein (TIGR00290 family)